MRSSTSASGYTHKGTRTECKTGGITTVPTDVAKIGRQRMCLREVGARDRPGSPNSLTEI